MFQMLPAGRFHFKWTAVSKLRNEYLAHVPDSKGMMDLGNGMTACGHHRHTCSCVLNATTWIGGPALAWFLESNPPPVPTYLISVNFGPG